MRGIRNDETLPDRCEFWLLISEKSARVGAKGVSAWKGSPCLGSPRSLSGLVCVPRQRLGTFIGEWGPCVAFATMKRCPTLRILAADF